MDEAQSRSQARYGAKRRVLLGVYRQRDLLMTLAKNAEGFAWIIGVPTETEVTPTTDDITGCAHALAKSLPSVIDCAMMNQVIGPEEICDVFTKAWVSHIKEIGVILKPSPPYFPVRVSFATACSLPEPSLESARHIISLAATEDISELVRLLIAFSRHGIESITEEEAHHLMTESVASRKVWICGDGEEIVGFTLPGRSTPRTIAIRNVFVLPEYRRRGIAEAMVRIVTRRYLGVLSLEVEGAPDSPPIEGTKEEVCLNMAVVGEAVRRLYTRCGFMLYEGSRDSRNGRKGSYVSVTRALERVSE